MLIIIWLNFSPLYFIGLLLFHFICPRIFLYGPLLDIDQLKLILRLVGTPGPELLKKISSESVSLKFDCNDSLMWISFLFFSLLSWKLYFFVRLFFFFISIGILMFHCSSSILFFSYLVSHIIHFFVSLQAILGLTKH